MALLLRYGIYVIPLLQIGCMIHAYRTGRPYYWFWLILFFPPIGAIAYFVLEILPGVRWDQLFDDNLGFLTFFKKRRLAKLADQAEFSPTVENRMAYAQELSRQKRHEEAATELKGCLVEPHRDDPVILLALCRTLESAGRWQEVLETVHLFRPTDYQKAESILKHLSAVALDNLDHRDEAEKLYRELLPGWPGEEVRCRLARILDETGNHSGEVRHLLEETVNNARRGTSHYRATNSLWISFARRKLKALS